MSPAAEELPTTAGMQDTAAYTEFWRGLGAAFPSLKGAPSTDYYFACERTAWTTFFPNLDGKVVLKTDLWNEAKGTEILQWAHGEGARVVAVDIAFDTTRQARRAFGQRSSLFVTSDTRTLPFGADAFDLVYSMGTIEHFDDYHVAAAELARVLKPGGTAIIGVPNLYDPFLRPLLVWAMNLAGVYAYGAEKAFSPAALRQLMHASGLEVIDTTGVLFMPGWLRMLDLVCHTRVPALTPLTGALVRPFAWLYDHVPAVRRHGYLIACVVRKPARSEAP